MSDPEYGKNCRHHVQDYSHALRMELVNSAKMSTHMYQTKQRNIPEATGIYNPSKFVMVIMMMRKRGGGWY
jgi:hypothetical protein